MLNVYQARSITKRYENTKGILEDIEDSIYKEAIKGKYKTRIAVDSFKENNDIIFVLNRLSKESYRVTFSKEVIWGNITHVIFDISWEREEK